MAQQISCTIWLPYGLVLILMIFCSVTVLITPTESSSAVPLIRQRTDSNASNGNESSISDADVQKRIQEVFNRKGYSNPDPSPNDSLEAQPDKVAVRIDGAPARRRKRPLWKIDENFDPRKSYVIKHPNGTITYVPPKDVDLSGTVSTTGTTATPAQGNPNELVDKMSEASTSDSDKLRTHNRITFEYPIRSNIENYPNELIDALVVQQGYADEFYSHPDDEEDDRLVFHNRMSFDDDFEALCEIIQQPDYPQEGYTVDNQLTKIVNTKKHKQRVDTERCRNKDCACLDLESQFMKTECRQISHEKTLYALNETSFKIYKAKIMIPSCCKCMVIRYKGF
ncbi:uncharacterized protein LOC109424643 isoform X5 [Aedes albopictus]|uniref:Spaetzle domain-containing protein n=1 Tax=Aedes albopictus TaxID=7160 RepID=A0ABM1XNG2_AEDAL